MSTNQSTLEVVGARTIDQIRKDGLDKQLKERKDFRRKSGNATYKGTGKNAKFYPPIHLTSFDDICSQLTKQLQIVKLCALVCRTFL
jgi:hypothetical protein